MINSLGKSLGSFIGFVLGVAVVLWAVGLFSKSPIPKFHKGDTVVIEPSQIRGLVIDTDCYGGFKTCDYYVRYMTNYAPKTEVFDETGLSLVKN